MASQNWPSEVKDDDVVLLCCFFACLFIVHFFFLLDFVSILMPEAEPATGVLFDVFVLVLAQGIVRPVLEWKQTFIK